MTTPTSPATPFVLGVNYWPRRKAMYWWRDFDLAEVREEFAVIAATGMTIVRLFLLWDDWMPTPDAVSEDCLKWLGQVADVAVENGLKLDVTFFTGHMSGPNWSPRWLLDKNAPVPSRWVKQVVSNGVVVPGYYRNMFTDPVARTAERLLLTKVVTLLKDHPAVWLWNLGNEPDLFAEPPTSAQGRAWVAEMVELIKSIDPVRPVTIGLHTASLNYDNGLRIDQAFAETDIAVMHSYPMYAHWSRGDLDPDFVPYTCALTAALSGKPILAEEWGGCTSTPRQPSAVWQWKAYNEPRKQFMASEEEFAEYVAQVLPRLVEIGSLGAMLWCYADYIEELWDKPPCEEAKHERFFGLVRPDGSLKPHAEVIRKFAATNPVVNTNPRKLALDVTPDQYYEAPLDTMIRLYQNW